MRLSEEKKLYDEKSSRILFHLKLTLGGSELLKELSFCHKLWFSNPLIFATRCRRSLIFQTLNSESSNSLSLKYLRFIPSGCRDIGVLRF